MSLTVAPLAHVKSVLSAACVMPAVTGISPNFGSTAGGNILTVTGCGFTGATAMAFGSIGNIAFTVNSDSDITVHNPNGPAATVDVTVTTPAGTSATSSADLFTFISPTQPCATAALSSDVASPQPAGATITFAATTSACLSPEFLFYLQAPGQGWLPVQSYVGPTFAWATYGLAPGTYNIDVWVRESLSGVPYQAFTLVSYVLTTTPACAGAGITPDKVSPQQSGTVVTFTAVSTSCPNPQYLFFVQPPGGGWTPAFGYDGPIFAWNTGGLGVGTYNVDVWVRQQGSGAPYQSFQLISYTLSPAGSCAAAGITADKPSPLTTGTIVTFTATSTTCSQPLYLWYLQPPGGGWMVAQSYDGAKFIWNTKVVPAGTWSVDVWVRQNGSSAPYEAFALINYTLPTCAGAGLTSDKASPQQSGTIVKFTATSTSCQNPEYRFYVQAPGVGWMVARDYGPPTFVWNTARLAVGAYSVDVWVRHYGSTVPYESFQLNSYMLSAALPCAAATLTPNIPSPQPTGTGVTFTATSTGCSQPDYLFYQNPSCTVATPGGWGVVQVYGRGPTFFWVTGGFPLPCGNVDIVALPPGTYQIDVWVRQNGSTAPYETFLLVNYTLT
jgi:spore coat protein U-like protein